MKSYEAPTKNVKTIEVPLLMTFCRLYSQGNYINT